MAKGKGDNQYQITFDEEGMNAFDAFLKARKQVREENTELDALRQRVSELEAALRDIGVRKSERDTELYTFYEKTCGWRMDAGIPNWNWTYEEFLEDNHKRSVRNTKEIIRDLLDIARLAHLYGPGELGEQPEKVADAIARAEAAID